MDELDRLSTEEFHRSAKSPLVVVLENVRSMHNVGSVFRTCDAFLVEKIYLCGFTPTPPHREIQKTALGATETVSWEAVTEIHQLIKDLKEQGYLVYAVEQIHSSISLDLFFPEKDKKIVFVFGNEADGLSEETIELCNGAIEIPQFGSKHSFNISVSAGIVLWDVMSKLNRR